MKFSQQDNGYVKYAICFRDLGHPEEVISHQIYIRLSILPLLYFI